MKRIRILSLVMALFLLVGMFPVSALAASDYNMTYYIELDQTNQIVTVYRTEDDVIVRQMLCSAGLNGATPNGTYYLPKGENQYDRKEWYHFKGFGVYAKYPTRIFKGILFHSLTYRKRDETTMSTKAIEEYGDAASHGCVRLLVDDAKWIQDNCPIGTRCRIYESGVKDPELRALLFTEHYTIDSGMTYLEYVGVSEGSIGRFSSTTDVKRLQYRMAQLGYYTGSIDGKFEGETVNAVLRIQRDLGLEKTGIVDSDLNTLICSDDAPTFISADLNEGDIGPMVRAFQKNLAALGLYTGEMDGIYDLEVINAANMFASAYGYDTSNTASQELQEAVAYELQKLEDNLGGTEFTPTVMDETVDAATVNFDGMKIRLREKADSQSKELASLENGTRLLLLEQGKTWSKVQYGQKEGYMKTKYLTFDQMHFYYLKYTSGDVTYRIGRTLSQRKKGTKMPAEDFKAIYEEIVAQKKESLKVEADPSNTTTTQVGLGTAQTAEAEETPEAVKGTVNTGSDDVRLNLRANPNTGADILTEIANGTEIDVLLVNGDWAYADYNGTKGYLLSQYVTTEDGALNDSTQSSGVANAATAVSKSAVIATGEGFAYVYESADKKSQKIGYIVTGESVNIFEEEGEFSHIRYSDKKGNNYVGYILNETLGQLSVQNDTTMSDSAVNMKVYAYVVDTIDYGIIYTEASEDSKKVGKLKKGAKVTIIFADEDSDWCQIKYNKKTGYMKNSELRFEMEDA